jgi:hypothetical protein
MRVAWQVRAGEPLVGRDREVAAVDGFLDGFPDKADGAGLLLLGEPGIGKSALWGLTVGEALRRGWTVLTSRAAQAEAGLSFTGLMDLLEGVADTVLPELPEPLATALAVALLRRSPSPTGHPPGQREVSLARSPPGGRCWSPSTTCSGWIRPRRRCSRSRCGGWPASRCG